ncbi:MAG: sulfite exporter TauE/SafE family protein [Nitrospirota bacterium]|nr:sulfite exporter TauE/SafE family protein [Nitrospirota bacterium]
MRKVFLLLTFIVVILAICLPAGVAEAATHTTGVANTFLLVIIGIFVGAVGTLIGAGGGFLVVPVLIIFYGFSPQFAVGTSMAVVFFNAVSGTFSYMAQSKVDYELGVKFAVAAVPGVFIGAFATQAANVTFFSGLFACLMLTMAYLLIFVRDLQLVTSAAGSSSARIIRDSYGAEHVYTTDLSIGTGGSFLVGIISGLFGIGGGIIHVPLMSFIGMPMHIATATSHFIITITSFIGMLIFLGLKTVEIDFAIPLGIGAIIGAYAGANLALITGAEAIKKLIAVLLLLGAARLLAGVL